MPELPEAETVRQDVARRFAGKTLESLSVTGRRTVRRHPPDKLASLVGRALADVGRHGKYLLFVWDDGQVLVAHLRMSGQLLARPAGAPLAKHTHAVLSFGAAGELRFVDPRTFGELFLGDVAVPPPRPASKRREDGEDGPGPVRPAPHPELAAASLAQLGHLGPDALTVRAPYLAGALAGRRAPLKSLMVDQRVLAGVGNIYADEICFAAGLRPQRPGGSLRAPEVTRLARSVRSVLRAAVVARGSTLADKRYRDLYGNEGGYQLEHKVYGRAGQGCATCGATVQRVRLGAKSAYFCPECQR